MSHFSRIENWMYDLTREDPDLRVETNAIRAKLESRHRFNIEYHLPIRTVELRELYLADYQWGEDYTTEATFKNDLDEPSELYRIEDVEARVEELEESMRELSKRSKKRKGLQGIIDGWKDAEQDPTYDEVVSNWVWRPLRADDIDLDAARKANLGVVTFDSKNHQNEQYLGLCGGGMDLSPLMMAYIVLTLGVVDPEHAHYLYRRSDFCTALYLLGANTMIEILDKLGVLESAIICQVGRPWGEGSKEDKFTPEAIKYFKKKYKRMPEVVDPKDPAYPYVQLALK